MPKEQFYWSGQVEGDGLPADLVISWGGKTPEVAIACSSFPSIGTGGSGTLDRSGLNRLIKVLRKARDQTYGEDS